ncbi:MAG: glutaminase [Micrococcus sp.]|nr:glutaminase [Micrococcus sp.]
MSTPVQMYLSRLAHAHAGSEASPGASDAVEREDLGIALTLVDGFSYHAGPQTNVPLGALAAPLIYALAIEDHGVTAVMEKVGTTPADDPRHRVVVEPGTGRALNPMQDAGMVAAAALIKGRGGRDRAARLMHLAGQLIGREASVTDTAARAEDKANRHTRAAAWLLKALDALDADTTAVLADISRLRALTVSVEEISQIAAIFARGGVHPSTGERVLSESTTSVVIAVMGSCGLVTRDPHWAMTVGQPGWGSSTGGTIMVIMPGHLGLALQSRGLDEHGLSARGRAALQELATEFELHPGAAVGSPRSALRSHYRVDQAPSGTVRTAEVLQVLDANADTAHLMELGGHVGFSQVESLVHVVSAMPAELQTLVLDIRSVSSVSKAARRLTAQWVGQALAAGLDVVVADRNDQLIDELMAEAAAHPDIQLPEPHREATPGDTTADPADPRALFVFFNSRSQAMQWCEQRILARYAPSLLPATQEEAAFSPMLQHLSADDASLLESMMDTRTFADGQVIRRAGQPFGGIYVITAGRVVLTGQSTAGGRIRRSVLTPGMTFGEMALGQPGRQPSTVRALGPVTTRVLTAQVMYALQEAAPQLAIKLWESLARDAYTALGQLVRETGSLQD